MSLLSFISLVAAVLIGPTPQNNPASTLRGPLNFSSWNLLIAGWIHPRLARLLSSPPLPPLPFLSSMICGPSFRAKEIEGKLRWIALAPFCIRLDYFFPALTHPPFSPLPARGSLPRSHSSAIGILAWATQWCKEYTRIYTPLPLCLPALTESSQNVCVCLHRMHATHFRCPFRVFCHFSSRMFCHIRILSNTFFVFRRLFSGSFGF